MSGNFAGEPINNAPNSSGAANQQSSSCDLKGFFQSEKTKTVLSIVGVLSACAVIAVAIIAFFGSFVSFPPAPKDTIMAIYQIEFGIIMFLGEIKLKMFLKWFRFLIPYFGLGSFYLFLAIFTLSEGMWYQYLVAGVVGALGVLYCCLSFMGQTRNIDISEEASRQQIVKYSAQAANVAASHVQPSHVATAAVAASAHLEEGRSQRGGAGGQGRGNDTVNPFENDNPFESSSNYNNYGKSAYV